MSRKVSIAKRIAAGLALITIGGCLVPERLVVPVDGSSRPDWNASTFWFEPWGASGVHKGIDIFAQTGTRVLAASGGLVLFSGNINRGGNVLLILGPKWRLHYYAHMDATFASFGEFVSSGESIGLVGSTGNAAGKQSHLHYAILSIIPYPWLMDMSTQGWKKMFYLDPNTKLQAANGV